MTAEAAVGADEPQTLVGFLEFQRATFAWKCQGMDATQLQARVAASTLTLGGMIKHLAYYEDHWFSYRMQGNERHARWNQLMRLHLLRLYVAGYHTTYPPAAVVPLLPWRGPFVGLGRRDAARAVHSVPAGNSALRGGHWLEGHARACKL